MPTTDPQKLRVQQRRWRNKNREKKRQDAKKRIAAMTPEEKAEFDRAKREYMRRRARIGGHGRRYAAPRTFREWLAHLHGWSKVELAKARKFEAHRERMAAHDAWIESLDQPPEWD